MVNISYLTDDELYDLRQQFWKKTEEGKPSYIGSDLQLRIKAGDQLTTLLRAGGKLDGSKGIIKLRSDVWEFWCMRSRYGLPVPCDVLKMMNPEQTEIFFKHDPVLIDLRAAVIAYVKKGSCPEEDFINDAFPQGVKDFFFFMKNNPEDVLKYRAEVEKCEMYDDTAKMLMYVNASPWQKVMLLAYTPTISRDEAKKLGFLDDIRAVVLDLIKKGSCPEEYCVYAFPKGVQKFLSFMEKNPDAVLQYRDTVEKYQKFDKSAKLLIYTNASPWQKVMLLAYTPTISLVNAKEMGFA